MLAADRGGASQIYESAGRGEMNARVAAGVAGMSYEVVAPATRTYDVAREVQQTAGRPNDR